MSYSVVCVDAPLRARVEKITALLARTGLEWGFDRELAPEWRHFGGEGMAELQGALRGTLRRISADWEGVLTLHLGTETGGSYELAFATAPNATAPGAVAIPDDCVRAPAWARDPERAAYSLSQALRYAEDEEDGASEELQFVRDMIALAAAD